MSYAGHTSSIDTTFLWRSMSILRRFLKAIVIVGSLLLAQAAVAQTAEGKSAENANETKDASAVAFTLDWKEAQPAHYSIKVDSVGHTSYESLASAGTDPSDMYRSQFVMSDALRGRIFGLAKQANYFEGKFDYTKSKIANTGQKTLEYAAGGKHTAASYNWSESPEIQQLTDIFYGISNTLESGSKLAFMKRFDRLGLPEQLQNMQRLRAEGHLLELQTITPLLQQIAQDSSLMNLARQRARQLMQGQ